MIESLYNRYVLPPVLAWTMERETFAPYRRGLLAEARGVVLELGAGGGANLPFYPRAVSRLVAADISAPLQRRARGRGAPFPVEHVVLDGGRLPFPDAAFDRVVSTWTLCSILENDAALAEVARVLRPDGRFLFVEHGLSGDRPTQRWQRRLTPVQRRLAGGCHLDRDIAALVARRLTLLRLERSVVPGSPRLVGSLYCGVAARP